MIFDIIKRIYYHIMANRRYDKKLDEQIILEYYEELMIMDRIYQEEKNIR